ncbi:hypothetical protein PWO95_06340 [Weissella paramesenteroides]|uniref:hypothetical protein n=1 Tax=Weissella paramesenteroides TaxID=1249 RepID=UPI0023A9E395|nr:hypothetical protein [Weissella paramesenteroides]WEA52260.1 hypothetical protein PWO95_06340 [Weissella paramesenteroides]
MTNKAYIVANEQQEREVLEKLEEKGALWINGKNATDFIPFRKFPYVIYCNGDKYISWDKLGDLDVNKIIVFDGRKEEKMSEKYVVTQEFMNTLNLWREKLPSFSMSKKFVGPTAIQELDDDIDDWWNNIDLSDEDNNNRLIAIIRWVNGEDVFEVEKPKKWVVRSKEPQGSVDGEPLYIWFVDELTLETETEATMPPYIRRFNTKEEAQSWANSHQEVIEVEI